MCVALLPFVSYIFTFMYATTITDDSAICELVHGVRVTHEEWWIKPRDAISRWREMHIYVYIHICKYVCGFLARRHFYFFRPRIFPRALGFVARREPTRTPCASLGPGRGPWHVLWRFKVASPLREGFRTRRAIQAHANPRT